MYRFFEVDDLICNTLGGMLGFVMTPVFVFMLPKHERMDEIAYKRGQVVSEFRRAVAWIIDIVVIIFDGE
jgi:glycopeptide antibiotics resistance protein